jgi:hypothetical protein
MQILQRRQLTGQACAPLVVHVRHDNPATVPQKPPRGCGAKHTGTPDNQKH